MSEHLNIKTRYKIDIGEHYLNIRWQCRACGCFQATLKKSDETEHQTITRIIRDHIKHGCAAYSNL